MPEPDLTLWLSGQLEDFQRRDAHAIDMPGSAGQIEAHETPVGLRTQDNPRFPR